MGFPEAHPPERRQAVEALLRDPGLSFTEIAARTGIAYATIQSWNARAGWIRPAKKSRRPNPADWSGERREALARLYREARNDPGDIAEVAGVGRSAGRALFLASGLILRDEPGTDGDPPRRRPPEPEPLAPLDAASASDAPTLRAHLRAHVARQIAAFDAALRGEGATVLDSARVLRDLGGLKRLFDDICEGERRDAGPGEGGFGSSPEPRPDPETLRADIARRYARFVEAGDAGCVPRDPAG